MRRRHDKKDRKRARNKAQTTTALLARRRARRRLKGARVALVRVAGLLGVSALVAVIAVVGVEGRAGVLRLLLLAVGGRLLVGAGVVTRLLLVPALVVATLVVAALVVALAVRVHLRGIVVAADSPFSALGRHPAGSVHGLVALLATAAGAAPIEGRMLAAMKIASFLGSIIPKGRGGKNA